MLGKFGAFLLLRPFPGRKIVRALIILPFAVPVALATIAWRWMFDSLYSVINWTLDCAGILDRADAPNWLGNPYLAMLCVVIINAWRFFPFAIVIFLAGITAVPQDVIDAATVDGAGFWRRNYQIILPMILPIMAIGLIFGIVFTFTDLSIVFLLTRAVRSAQPRCWALPAFRPASSPATCRMARPSRCSCCRCCWSS